ncbi:hypothetical protein Trydic_g19065 [Trypoxylus dichotomus]
MHSANIVAELNTTRNHHEGNQGSSTIELKVLRSNDDLQDEDSRPKHGKFFNFFKKAWKKMTEQHLPSETSDLDSLELFYLSDVGNTPCNNSKQFKSFVHRKWGDDKIPPPMRLDDRGHSASLDIVNVFGVYLSSVYTES